MFWDNNILLTPQHISCALLVPSPAESCCISTSLSAWDCSCSCCWHGAGCGGCPHAPCAPNPQGPPKMPHGPLHGPPRPRHPRPPLPPRPRPRLCTPPLTCFFSPSCSMSTCTSMPGVRWWKYINKGELKQAFSKSWTNGQVKLIVCPIFWNQLPLSYDIRVCEDYWHFLTACLNDVSALVP